MSVYDIRIITQRPTLTLLLDADYPRNFNAANPAPPQDDLPYYVPGDAYPSRLPKPVPASGTLIDTIDVVAAYVLSNGMVTPPPPGITSVLITLQDVSAYVGIAMNYGSSGGSDFTMPTSIWTFSNVDHVARAQLEVHDYGGKVKINAAAGPTPDVATMLLPLDNVGQPNGIADTGWSATANGVILATVTDSGQSQSVDTDAAPPGNGTSGDGIVFFEEYRGFVVRGELRRIDPATKDVFVYSALPQGIGDSINLPITKHRINIDELSGLSINFNYVNGGTPVPGHYAQKALKVIDGGCGPGNTYGHTDVIGTPTDQTAPIQIYVAYIEWASPPNNGFNPPTPCNDISGDPYDDAAIRYTLGHEIGHGTNINHVLSSDCADPSLTVMVGGYLPATSSLSDPCWLNIRHAYDNTDKSQIKIRN